jgi:hypothetical protein
MPHELNPACSGLSGMILLFMILLNVLLFSGARNDAGAPG